MKALGYRNNRSSDDVMMSKAAQTPVEGRAAKERVRSNPNPGKPLKTAPRAKTARSKRSASSAPSNPGENNLVVQQLRDEDPAVAFARTVLAPGARHGLVAASYANGLLPKDKGLPEVSLVGGRAVIEAEAEKAASGDMGLASRMLASQAVVLDSMFVELARRAANNMEAGYLDATTRYMNLALKAQGNARTTLEALAKLHTPREQVIKHIHVGQGGQAVVADQFHHHGGGPENVVSVEQPHGQGARGPALLGEDTGGNSLPVAGNQRPAQVPVARGE